MFGHYMQSPESREKVAERIEQLHLLLGEDAPEAATKTKRTDDRRDSSGRRKEKQHQPGQPAPQPTRRRDADGYRLDKAYDPDRRSR